MRFLTELRRRNVIRMAGLYLVGAWLIVQVAETLLPAFDVPGWVLRALIILLALGFVPALVFSWVFELTPDGLKRDDELTPEQSITRTTGKRMDRLLLFGMALVLVVIAADRFWPQAATSITAQSADSGDATSVTIAAITAQSGSDPAAVDPNSIAVLPFVNMSADKDNEYFSDGISEELLNVLVKVDGLSVASRTSSFAYKGRELGTAAIADELKVAHILEGSVRKSGTRVRITAQLIDATSDRHLWSETFDRELTDIFAIQDEIANAIVVALRDTLDSDPAQLAVRVRADTGNLDAYESYLKARELFIARVDLDESVRLFEQAVALDPSFARGWEGLAAACAVIIDWFNAYPSIDRAALKARAQLAAERALDIDPSLSMPWAARSLLISDSMPIDYENALATIDKAIVADPRNATAFLWRGILWIGLGFLDRGSNDLDTCLKLDPAYANCLRWKALAMLLGGDTDSALVLYKQGMLQGFNANRGDSFVEPLLRRGDDFAAILLMRELRWPVEIQRAVLTLSSNRVTSPDIAVLAEQHKALDRALYEWGLLLRNYDLTVDTPTLTSSMVEHWDPVHVGLRASPAFKRLMMRFGAPAYWRQHGYPPACHALGDDDFECSDTVTTP